MSVVKGGIVYPVDESSSIINAVSQLMLNSMVQKTSELTSRFETVSRTIKLSENGWPSVRSRTAMVGVN